MDFLLVMGITLGILLLSVLGMAIGVIFQNKPIQHCGSGALNYHGEKISCPACANADSCTRRKDKAPAAS